jgi:hypothetical protein
MKFLKYKFFSFFSHHLGGPLPKKPFDLPDDPGQLLSSTGGRFIKRIMRSPGARRFAVGVLYLKKAMPRADEAMLEEARQETKKFLTEDHPVPPCTVVDFSGEPVALSHILEQVRRTVREICRPRRGQPKFRIDESVLHHPYAPSVKANYVDTRSRLGTFGTLFNEGFLEEADFDDSLRSLASSRMTGMLAEGLSTEADPRRGRLEYLGAVEELVNRAVELEGRVGEDEIPLSIRDKWRSDFQTYYSRIYEDVRSRIRGNSDFDVKLVALAESLKIRVISKGPPLHYFVLKPIQKFLSKLIGRIKNFRLTKETVSSRFLSDFFEKHEGLFASLDYSAASDNINPRCSEECADSFSDELDIPSDLRAHFRSALTGHTIEGEPQKWGQLMGSIMSFVVLCVINFAVTRYSYELSTGRRVSLRMAPILVNGDDGLVRCNSSFMSIWERVAAQAGLVPSVGKVYLHETYANINSTSFEWHGDHFRQIPYVNMGLVVGNQRSKTIKDVDLSSVADVIDPRVGTLGARHRTLIDSCPNDANLRIRVHDLFVRHHRSLLSACHEMPLFIPEFAGGFGCRALPHAEFDLAAPLARGPSTWEVRAFEHFLAHQHLFHEVRSLPTTAQVAARLAWTSLIPFRNSRLRSKQYNLSEDDLGLLDVSAYYTIPSLVVSNSASRPVRILNHNMSVWATMRRHFSPNGEDATHAPMEIVPWLV